ncbi:DUF5763 domain-containing protein [Pedobacter westerhofensis]|uniref:DUF5763 domain-containing protein n=1 Tax=Pedobacter westerhofensis TaxID=425512 RepID=UPI001C8F893D
MKNIGLVILFCSLLTFTSSSAKKAKTTIDKRHATCRGSANCSACSSCNYCGHCNSGGICGVCSSGSSGHASSAVKAYAAPRSRSISATSSQCKGTTKKGARCKRMVKGGGYCWQHS